MSWKSNELLYQEYKVKMQYLRELEKLMLTSDLMAEYILTLSEIAQIKRIMMSVDK